MAIKDWPAEDRPREKLLLRGATALSDAELLAIFLRTGVQGLSAVELARNLLQHFGSLRELLAADKASFCAEFGLGTAKYVQLQAVLEMSRRYLESTLMRADAFENAQTTKHYIQQQLKSYTYEVFACLFLDNQHRMIVFEELFRGTIDGAHVYPREVIKKALEHGAAAVIFAHNHPSGCEQASQQDIVITQRLKAGLDLVDIRVLDHIIVADATTYSLAEAGHL